MTLPAASRALAWVFLSLSWVLSTSAGAAQCPAQIDSDDCFANDLQPSGTEIVSGPAYCTQGELISAVVRIKFEGGGGANDRYSLGFYIGENGEPAIGGSSCAFDSLQPVGGTPNLTGGSGPFLELNGDGCGDISKSEPTYKDIRIDRLLCKDDDGDRNLDVDMALSWVNNGSKADCQDPLDPAEFDPAPPKCLSVPEYNLPIVVERPPSMEVGKSASPSKQPEPGGLTRYTVSIINTSPAATDTLTVTSIRDQLYGNVADLVDCALPFELAPGQIRICTFFGEVSGVAGDVIGGPVTVAAVDDEGDFLEASDSASVEIVPSDVVEFEGDLRMLKFAAPARIREPGGTVSYIVALANVSETSVQVTGLEDDLYGNLDGKGDCTLPQTLALPDAFYFCSFQEEVRGEPGDTVTDTITATGVDFLPRRTQLQAQDSATVTILDVPADIRAKKVANPQAVFEPGGVVEYTLAVQNISAVDDVTIDFLQDNLADALGGNCALPFTLAPGEVYRCQYPGAVSGNAGDSRTNTVTASGLDDDGQFVSDRAAASVFFLGAPPSLEVRKLALPPVALDEGSPVTFTVAVQNTSSVADPVTLTSMVDSVYGPIDGMGSCSLPRTLQPAPSPDSIYVCSFLIDNVSGTIGEPLTNTVTVSGVDDEGTAVEASDDATVDFFNPLPEGEPALNLIKLASPAEVPETGGDVTFTLLLTNIALVPDPDLVLDVTGLVDDIYGDLAGKVDCALPINLPVGATVQCHFTETVSGDAGEVITDTVTATATDQAARTVTASSRASVTITDVPSSIEVDKSANPTSLQEPGGDVTFDVEVLNNSPVDTVAIDSLVDSAHGDLIGQGLCPAPGPLAPGETYACTFTVEVSGEPGETELNTVTASGVDDDAVPVQGSAQASVTILDTAPSITVSKRASPSRIAAGKEGEPVTYTFTVTNTSPVDTVELDTLEDSAFGNLDGRGDCSVPQVLPPGGAYRCTFTTLIAGAYGQTHRNEVVAEGVSDDGVEVAGNSNAIVSLLLRNIPATGLAGLIIMVLLFSALAVYVLRR